jgi:uncharacterized protein (DUF1778 family)
MDKDASVTFRLPAADRAALERAAKLEDRPITAMVRRIIAEWLRAQAKRAKP